MRPLESKRIGPHEGGGGMFPEADEKEGTEKFQKIKERQVRF